MACLEKRLEAGNFFLYESLTQYITLTLCLPGGRQRDFRGEGQGVRSGWDGGFPWQVRMVLAATILPEYNPLSFN